jgi:hypothetical protein
MFFIPESPRWLILQGRYEEGLKALTWLRPDGFDASGEAAGIQAAIDREKEMSSGIGPLDMIKNPVDRRRTILAVCAVTLQAASGSMFIIGADPTLLYLQIANTHTNIHPAYKAYFFTMAKVTNPFAMTNVLSCMGLIAIILNSLIIVKYGRRRVLLMTGLLFCGVLQLIIAIVYTKQPGTKSTGNVTVGLSCIYLFSYNGMIATYAWLAGGEIPTQRLRSYTFGLAAAVGFFFAWLTTFTAPYFINPASLDWGPKYGYIWFPSCLIAAAWVFFFLPEVKNRTLEEIDEMFEARLPARKFKTYKCVGVLRDLDKDARKSIEREKEVQVMQSEKMEAETAIAKE